MFNYILSRGLITPCNYNPYIDSTMNNLQLNYDRARKAQAKANITRLKTWDAATKAYAEYAAARDYRGNVLVQQSPQAINKAEARYAKACIVCRKAREAFIKADAAFCLAWDNVDKAYDACYYSTSRV